MEQASQIYLLQSNFLVDYVTVSQREWKLWLGDCCQPALHKVNQMWVKKWRTLSSRCPHLKSRADFQKLI